MAYEPLHHKYRPQTFAELVGQGAIATTLANALRQQRIAPAYLFTGARGTGKTSSARILAKSLNCLSSNVPTENPCGICEVCRTIANGSALDVIEIDAASNTGVDNIRELIERAQFAPVQCRYKVYVVDECHMLSTQAFNALLKTLEEPPDRVVFVLATTDPQRVLPTIISRCQRFDFRRIPLDEMVVHLGAIAAKESIDIASDAVLLVAQLSQGGLRDAESLLDQLSLLEGQITVERVWDLVGAVPERDLLMLVQAIAQDDSTTVIEQTRRLMDRGREPLIVLQNLASFYRDLLIAKTSPERNDLVAITPPTWKVLCEFAQELDLSGILLGQQQLRASEVQVKNTTQPRLWLEVTLMGLLPSALGAPQRGSETQKLVSPLVRPSVPPSAVPASQSAAQTASAPAVAQSVESPESAISQPVPQDRSSPEPVSRPVAPSIQPIQPTKVQPTQPETAAVSPSVPSSNFSSNLDEVWEDILRLVQPFSTRIMLSQQCLLLAFNGKEARIGARSKPLFNMAKAKLPNVEAAFSEFCDHPIKVSLEVVQLSQAAANSTQITEATRLSPSFSETPAPRAQESNGMRYDFNQPTSNQSSTSNQSTSNQPPAHQPAINQRPVSPPDPNCPNQQTHEASLPQPPTPTIPPFISSPIAESSSPQPISPAWTEEDEVSRAAKSLAQMFNGQIVNMEDDRPDDIAPLSASGSEAGLEGTEDGDPDDDVPF